MAASYPYNAVHVAELPGPLDAARLSQAVDRYLTEAGIGRLALDAKAAATNTSTARSMSTARVAADGDTLAHLEREMERYLNERFGDDDAPFVPLRFFVVDSGASFHLGVAYDHFIAGGDSVVALLKAIAARYDGTLPADHRPPAIYPAHVRAPVRPERARVLRRPVLAARACCCVRGARSGRCTRTAKTGTTHSTSFELLAAGARRRSAAPQRRGASRATISCWR